MIGRQSLLIVLNNVAGAAFGLVASYFMGHYLGKDAMGMWAFALALTGLASFVGDFGLSYAHQKRVSEAGADVGVLVGSFARLRLVTVGAMTLVFLGALGVWTFVLGKSLTDATTIPVLLIALAYTVLVFWLNLPKATFVGMGRIASGEAPVFVEHVVRVGAVVFVSLWFGVAALSRRGPLSSRVAPLLERLPDLDARPETAGLLLAAAHAAAMLAAVLAAYALFARARIPVSKASPDVTRDYVRLGLPVALYLGVAVVATQLDRVMVGYFWSDADVGEYFAAQRIVLLILAFPNAIFTTLFPRVSYHLSKNEMGHTRDLMIRAERYMSMVLFLVLALVVTFAEQGLNLIFGAGFVTAAPVLRALALFVLFTSLAKPYHALATGAGRPGLLFQAGLIMAVLNVGLNLVFIPRSVLGVETLGLRSFGAALATAISSFAAFVFFRVRAQKLMPTPYVMPFHAKHVTAAICAWAVITLPEVFVQGDFYAAVGDFFPLAWLVAGNLLAIEIYVLVLIFLGEVSWNEVKLAREVLHPIEMARHVRRDLKAKYKARP